jgi:hypothetical protein
MHDQESK